MYAGSTLDAGVKDFFSFKVAALLSGVLISRRHWPYSHRSLLLLLSSSTTLPPPTPPPLPSLPCMCPPAWGRLQAWLPFWCQQPDSEFASQAPPTVSVARAGPPKATMGVPLGGQRDSPGQVAPPFMPPPPFPQPHATPWAHAFSLSDA